MEQLPDGILSSGTLFRCRPSICISFTLFYWSFSICCASFPSLSERCVIIFFSLVEFRPARLSIPIHCNRNNCPTLHKTVLESGFCEEASNSTPDGRYETRKIPPRDEDDSLLIEFIDERRSCWEEGRRSESFEASCPTVP